MKRQSLVREAMILFSRKCWTEIACCKARGEYSETMATRVSLQMGSKRMPGMGRAGIHQERIDLPPGRRAICGSVVSSMTSSSAAMEAADALASGINGI
jgi:hypothetical protein